MPPKEKAKEHGHKANKPDDMWQQSYKTLKNDPEGKRLLDKLNNVLSEQLPPQKSAPRLRSEDGRKQLLRLIQKKSETLQSSSTSPMINNVCTVMSKAKDIVSSGAAASPPATIAVAALFMVFEIRQIYTAESQAMFDTAFVMANIMVRHAAEDKAIHSGKNESAELKDTRQLLRVNYLNLYRNILRCLAKLVPALYSNWFKKVAQNVTGWNDWPAELTALKSGDDECTKYLQTIHRLRDDPTAHAGVLRPGQNALHEAAGLNLAPKVFDLLLSGQYDINAKNRYEWTALSIAADRGYLGVVRTLLSARGIQLNSQNVNGMTALHLATLKNRVAVVRTLAKEMVKRKARINIRSKWGKTALLYAAREGYTEIVKILKEAGADINETTTSMGWSALHLAAERDALDIVNYLLKNGASKDQKIRKGNRAGMTAKEVAERCKSQKVLEANVLS